MRLTTVSSKILQRRRPGYALLCLVLCASLGTGCAEQVTVHGHQFREADIQQVQPGMAQEQVRMSLGSPTTTGTVDGGSAYYYISSTSTQSSFMKPTEKDRQVLAVYFNPTGTVDRVANYGLKDGKVFDYVSRTTPAPGARDEGLVKQLFRNLGTRQIFGE
jgi:outer membrane protein assembly factor BamE (lipoprotein component of BamABCDE complex)